ncbi:MAG: response regulator [Polyangiaceae bacterium]|nr:response regulator [Polyangiaceae bacterium]
MSAKTKPRILCVDDEPQILDGLALHLRRNCQLFTATSGREALRIIATEPSMAVVISDMRMPGMDGAEFLAEVRSRWPDVVRMLLTGQSDIESAIAAINKGQIFRFLTKPCPPPALLSAVQAALTQHDLITAERVLLEQTLHGSIKALTDMLALVSPVSFGRATRVKQLVIDIADHLGLKERWQVEVAAMLSQIGHMTLPAETAERLYYGRALSNDEQRLVARLPGLTESLLGNIPRLETVREILRTYPMANAGALPEDPVKAIAVRGASILRLAVDFDALESSDRASARLAVATLCGREGRYAADALAALVAVRGARAAEVREISSADLREGMILAEDVKTDGGVLLVARGHEITARFIERIRNFPPEPLRLHVWRVILPDSGVS